MHLYLYFVSFAMAGMALGASLLLGQNPTVGAPAPSEPELQGGAPSEPALVGPDLTDRTLAASAPADAHPEGAEASTLAALGSYIMGLGVPFALGFGAAGIASEAFAQTTWPGSLFHAFAAGAVLAGVSLLAALRNDGGAEKATQGASSEGDADGDADTSHGS